MPEVSDFIDRMRGSSGSLTRKNLLSILPYGDEFLFVDEVTRLTVSEVDARFKIPMDAPYIRSHFAGFPIMPGVLIGEGMAQAGTLLIRYNLESHRDKDILALEIESASFPAPALPGDTLDFHVRLLKLRRSAARLSGMASVGDRQVCRAQLVLAIVERHTLQAELADLMSS